MSAFLGGSLGTSVANSDVHDIESYSVDCVLIIGMIPDTKVKRKSFELIRHNSRDVRIFTFDELAAKLKEIYLLLKPEKEKGA